jgi:hypothetical protein
MIKEIFDQPAVLARRQFVVGTNWKRVTAHLEGLT